MPGLGKGLLSLMSSEEDVATVVTVATTSSSSSKNSSNICVLVNIEHIKINPYQPRQVFKHDELEALTSSIKEHGILQPLIASKCDDHFYELIAGERRLRAAKMLGMTEVPVFITHHKDSDKLTIALIENIQRQDLNPAEKARGLKRLLDEFNLTQEEIAKKVGMSRSAVANCLRLLSLPQIILDALIDGKISEGHARLILSMEDSKKQIALFNRIVGGAYTVKDTERIVQYIHAGKDKIIDGQISDLQNQLESTLGTKVKILILKNGCGKIVIEFYSEEEMQKIIQTITS